MMERRGRKLTIALLLWGMLPLASTSCSRLQMQGFGTSLERYEREGLGNDAEPFSWVATTGTLREIIAVHRVLREHGIVTSGGGSVVHSASVPTCEAELAVQILRGNRLIDQKFIIDPPQPVQR